MDRALRHRLNRRSLMARAGAVTTAAALTASIPTLTAQDVVRAALRQDGGKVTIGQVGDIQNLIPYSSPSSTTPSSRMSTISSSASTMRSSSTRHWRSRTRSVTMAC